MKNTIFDLSGRVALVTGGSQGLGKAMSRIFAEAGADVMICSRSEDKLKTAAAEIAVGTGVRVEYLTTDMTRRDQVKRLAETAVERLGKVDILVNNAGTNVPQPIDEIDDETWDHLLELNLTSCMALTRALVPGMKQRRWGRVIHISSVMGLGSAAGRSPYSTTKSALLGLCWASALDLGPYGITVNCIAPGPFATDLPMTLLSEEQKAIFAGRTALGRWGRPEELAGPALLLASDAGSFITGSVLLVDGGVMCKVF
ncbi:MAG TPA: SDR family NAD(P)-dependent oxidoreductase [Thermoguttaceae bacterium]|nr:SDR family NAD(P)-dependent oxidoreductase [Thermoguttaceae bacterium]